MNKATFIFLTSISYLTANPFQATLENEISWLNEETFVISASKVKESIEKTPSSVYVITDKTIEEMGAQTLSDVLKIVPGIEISQSHIFNDKISVRGIQSRSSEKVLILLDGHSLNINLLNGGATGSYKTLPLEFIKRIEVIKGPASSLYGENAFTALINIITKKAKDINGSIITTKIGSNKTRSSNLLHSQKYKTASIVLNLKAEKSDGKSEFVKSDAINKSGYTNPYLSSSNAYLSITDDTGYYIKGNINTIEEGPRYGAAYVTNNKDKSQRRAYFVELGYKNKITNNSDIHIKTYYDNYKTENKWEVIPNRVAYVGIENVKIGFDSLIKTKKDKYILVSGFSAEKQEIKNPWQKMNWNPTTENPFTSTASYNIIDYSDSSTNYIKEVDRKFWALYSEFIYDINRDLRLNLGIRYDNYTDFGGTTNPRIGLTWKINKNNNFKLSYAEAFRAPTFSELYNTNNPSIQGNENLKPETVKTLEITLENKSIKNLKLSGTLYNTEIEDLILLENTIQTNKNSVISKGVELELNYNLTRGSYLTANYTRKSVKNKTTNEDIVDISKNTAFVSLNKRINKYINFYTDVQYTGSQNRLNTDTRDKVSNSIITNGTILIKNFKSKNISLKFSVYNIFNETTFDSSTPYDYPISGRTYIGEFTFKF
jgi:iron complex outermembrane receptor protein